MRYKLRLKKQLNIENIICRAEWTLCEVQNEVKERVERRVHNEI